MSVLCDSQRYYFSNSGTGNSLLNSNIYTTDTGGAPASGYYCDGTYIYTVVESAGVATITQVESADSLSCGGLTPPDPTTGPPTGTLFNFAYSLSFPSIACSNAL